MTETQQIAETILQQLGGHKFTAMTGAKNLTAFGTGSLAFTLPGAGGFCKNGINRVTVTLDPSDTYTVTFLCVRGTKVHDVAQHHGIYADQLRSLFTSETGLEVSL